jgi:predicted amidohydrolase YtcJ
MILRAFRFASLVAATFVAGFSPAPAQDDPFTATLVVFGRVRTMDPRVPEAEAVVVLGDRVERVTTAAEAAKRIGPETKVVRTPPGSIVLPGLIESHAHLRGVGRASREVDLVGTTSTADAVARVKAAAESVPAGRWILGRGWNQERWTEKRWPTAADLDAVVADRPVSLARADGHAVWINSAALAIAGVTSATRDPAGGEILRNPDGSPSGVLVDNAVDLVARHAEARFDPALAEEDFLRAEGEAFRFGITTFVDAGENAAGLLTLLKLYDAGRLRLRVYGMSGVGTAVELVEALSRPRVIDHRGRFTVRAVKLYADGALGSRGAALLEPYADRPDARGLDVSSPAFLRQVADKCLERGLQLCVHAIGDRANRNVLDAMEGALAAPHAPDPRFRIEHAQHVDPRDVARFKGLGVLPSMQPCHATSDFPWGADRLGVDRLIRTGYRWRSLLDSGSIIPLGTDAPVEPLSPFQNFYAAVERRDPQGRDPRTFVPPQRMNRFEALAGMTTWGAYATFAETRRGKLSPGYDADLCVASEDLISCPPDAILRARCLLTVVAGEVVFEGR